MKFIFIFFLVVSICGCSSGGSESENQQGVFSAQENVDISDIEGFWVNACVESQESENIYTRDFIDYKSGQILNLENQISVGKLNSSDSNCSLTPVYDGNLTNVDYVPYLNGVASDFSPVGIYTNSEGIQLKVIEFAVEINNSTRLAYYINGDVLYFAYQINSNYELDYENPYSLSE